MSKLLLNLRNVPDDEADDVRAMLDVHGIAFYETSAETFRSVLRAKPGRVALTVLAILFLLGLVALPIILLCG